MNILAVGIAVVFVVAALAASQTPPPKVDKIDPVAVSGCLKETEPNSWMLVNASDPVASTANAPSPKELAALSKGGKNTFRLIGVAIFNLPAHKDHAVIVKGLPIKATPANRLNVTSVTMVSETCPPPTPAK
jgi:hypothetical protein